MSIYKKAADIWYKHITILGFIKVTKFITAHYVYTGSCKFVKCVYVLYCIVLCLAFVYFAHSVFPIRCVEFVLSVTISLLTADEYIFRYFRSLKTLDVVMGIKSRPIFDNRVRCLIAFLILCRILFLYVNYSWKDDVYFIISCNILLLNQRLDSLVVVMIFYALFTRMKFVRERLERNPIPIYIVSKNSVMNNIKELRRCLQDYNNLLDNFHDIDQELQNLMVVVIIYCMPKLVAFNLEMLRRYFLETWNFKLLMQDIEVMEGFVLICLPAVIADMIRHEVVKIKKALFRQAIRCSDGSLRRELEIALDYVTRHSFNFVLFSAVTLNMEVPLAIISVSITYIIVIIQFTHLNNIELHPNKV